MDTPTDFTTLLRTYMHCARRSSTDLAQVAGLSVYTIGNWIEGKVRRPRLASDILKLAQALALNAADTTLLLTAAGHPSLAQLQAQAQQTGNDALTALLRPWDQAAAPPVATAPPPAPSACYQLRAPSGDFVGRTEEIARLTTALRRAAKMGGVAAISGVQGMGGIGKTELAYKVAQQLRHDFPDAQIVVPLRGSSVAPLPPEQALQTVIHAFIPETKLPEDLPTLEGLYRTQLNARRVLILADDAASAAQVEPLLPPGGCALLVTGRKRFTLPAMTTIDLEQLPAAEATGLLRAICARLSEDEAATLARACGYLPLALRVSGSLLHNTPALVVADYLAQLADERRRLAFLRDPDHPQRNVEATLLLGYAQLDAATQAVFRQVGVLVADFTTDLALSVVTAPGGGDVAAALHALLRCNLVQYDPERMRWRLHDLVRDVARQRLEAAGEVEATYWRYARAAVALAAQTQEQYLAGGDAALRALAQFDAERPHIDAAHRWAQQHVQTTQGDQLLLETALATHRIGELRYDWRHEILPQWEGVRMAVQRLGDRTEEGHVLRKLGIAYAHLGEISTAGTYFEQALAAFREQGDRGGEGQTLNNLGLVYSNLGELPKASTHYEQALAIARASGDRRSEGSILNNLGLTYVSLGDLPMAVNCYQQRLAIARESGDRYGEGTTLANLGNIYTDLGDARLAIDTCEEALTIARTIGDRQMEAYTLSYLARAETIQGEIVQAANTFAHALTLLQELGDRLGLAEGQWLFGLALAQQGERERALPLLRAGLAYQQEIRHAKAAEHTALLARLEAGEPLPPELHVPKDLVQDIARSSRVLSP